MPTKQKMRQLLLSQLYSPRIYNEYTEPVSPMRDNNETILIDPIIPYNPSPFPFQGSNVTSTSGLPPNWSRRLSRFDSGVYYYN